VYMRIEPPRADEGRIQYVWPVRCANDEHILECFDAVHFVQQRRDNVQPAILRLVARLANGVNLVEENNAGLCRTRSAKNVADGSFRLAYVHLDKFRTFDRKKVLITLGCDGLGDQRLCAAWGPI
jgi:hypothetical protein